MKVVSSEMSITDYMLREDKVDNGEIIDHINYIGKKNPYAVISKHEDYLQGNPCDYIADVHYCKALAKIGRFEEAVQELQYIKEQYNRMVGNFIISAKKANPFKQDDVTAFVNLTKELQALWLNIVSIEFRILCNQNRFEEALAYFYANSTYLSNIADFVIFYLRARNGEFKGRGKTDSYLYNQILDYHESDLSKITRKRQAFRDKRGDKKEYSRFRESFPVDKVLAEVKQYISSLDGFYDGYLDKTYVFRCDSCGIAKGKVVNFFKVSVFNGTDDIYEFEPIDGYFDIPEYYDFTEFVKGGKVFKK